MASKRLPTKYKKKKAGFISNLLRGSSFNDKPAERRGDESVGAQSVGGTEIKRERKGSMLKIRFSSFVHGLLPKNKEIDLDSIQDVTFVHKHHKLDADNLKDSSGNLQVDAIKEDLFKHRDEVLTSIQKNMLDSVHHIPSEKELEQFYEAEVEVIRDDPLRSLVKEKRLGRVSNGELWQCSPKSKNLVNYLRKQANIGVDASVTAKVCNVLNPVEAFEEIALLSLSRGHESIVEYIHTYYSVKDNSLWIVCEFMPNSVSDILFHCYTLGGLNPAGSPWKEKYVSYVLREILQAIEFLHQRYRIHRNIRCENFLWDDQGHVKLTHFGDIISLTTKQTKRKGLLKKNFWSAPEILKGEEYDRASDIWSLGVSLIELVIGDPPWRVEETEVKAMLLIMVEPPPRLPKRLGEGLTLHWSHEVDHLVEIMCNKMPMERPLVTELLMHPYLQNACQPEEFGRFAKRMRHGFV